MASIARIESLAAALAKKAGEYVWLDGTLGLVVGTYPSPKAQFDFSSEKFRAIGAEQTATKRRISLLGEAKRVGKLYEIETEEAIYTVGSATQMLVEGLNIIESSHPGVLEELSKLKKQTKRPVARSRESLYDVPHPPAHSEKLKSGYYVATNNRASEAKGFLRAAAEIAGLEWGKSFIVRLA